MPLRLALMVAIGALLALGACSSDTKTVTQQADPDPAPMTDPDPMPTPTPASVTLPAGAADEFPDGDTTFTIRSIVGGHPATDVDGNGNRFVDRGGYRFICRGSDACIVTVTKDADGMLSVEASDDLRKGEVPAVAPTSAATRFLRPSSGNRQQFSLAAGGMETQNGVTMTCPAASADGCVVVIETRGTGMDAVTDAIGTGGVMFASAYPDFYAGLASYRADPARSTDDPQALGLDAGSQAGFGTSRHQASGVHTYAHVRTASDAEDTAPTAVWGGTGSGNLDQLVTVAPERVRDDTANAFAGFADVVPATEQAKTYGASPVGVRLGLEVTATYSTTTVSDEADAASRGLTWTIGLPAEKVGEGADAAFAYGDADMRSAVDRWSQGFTKTMRLGADTADVTADDGTLHIQAFTNYETDKTTDSAATTTVALGAVSDATGTVLAAPTGGVVPAAPPTSQRFSFGKTNGTLDGVPGEFDCPAAGGCTVATAGTGVQTVAGGALTFTPSGGTNALKSVDDTDWLAIGTWAVAMDNGNTVFGAFHQGGEDWGANITAAVGDATYAGIARGRFAEHNDGVRSSGLFSGDATFTANFMTNSAGGTIEGMVRDFSTTPYGGGTATDRDDWSLDFGSVTLNANSHFGFNFAVTGKWGSEDDNTLAGEANTKFYGPQAPAGVVPTAIAGSFLAASGANDDHYALTLFGAFGAVEQ